MKRILSIILFAAGVFGVGQAKEQLSPDQTLWFTSPAENWAQQALHIGNGYMGASFYGSVNRERFDIAEKTFWTGGPHSLSDFKSPIIKGGKDKIDEIRKLIVEKKYVEADSLCRKYMVGNYSHYGYFSMVGNLYIDFPESEHPVKDYVRGIDLSTSRGFVEYVQEDTYFKREYFCSYPDKLMVLHFTSDKKNKINFNLSQILTYPASQVKKETDIVLSICHSDASYSTGKEAKDLGVTNITHLFNGMTPLNHRNPGVVGLGLMSDMYCELIADKIHINKELFQFVIDSKGKDKLVLITDSMRAGCMPDGEYDLGGQTVYVKDNSARIASGSLAGSVLTLNKAVYNFKENTNLNIYEAINLASLNPAKSIKVDDKKGSLEIGKDADIAIFNENMDCLATIVEGDTIYNKIN